MDIKKLERELDLKEMQYHTKSERAKEVLDQLADGGKIKCHDGAQARGDIYIAALEEIQKIVANQPQLQQILIRVGTGIKDFHKMMERQSTSLQQEVQELKTKRD